MLHVCYSFVCYMYVKRHRNSNKFTSIWMKGFNCFSHSHGQSFYSVFLVLREGLCPEMSNNPRNGETCPWCWSVTLASDLSKSISIWTTYFFWYTVPRPSRKTWAKGEAPSGWAGFAPSRGSCRRTNYTWNVTSQNIHSVCMRSWKLLWKVIFSRETFSTDS